MTALDGSEFSLLLQEYSALSPVARREIAWTAAYTDHPIAFGKTTDEDAAFLRDEIASWLARDLEPHAQRPEPTTAPVADIADTPAEGIEDDGTSPPQI